MKRKLYILILLLLSVNFWYLKPIGRFLTGNTTLILQFAFILFGSVFYYIKGKKPFFLIRKGYSKPVIWIFAAVLLSFVPAYVNYGQGIVTSVLASKSMLLYLTLPSLLIVRPSFKDIEWALYVFSAIYFIVIVFDSILGIPIIEKIDGVSFESTRDYVFEGDFVHALEGMHFVGMAFIFSLSHLKKQFSSLTVLISFVLLIEIFIIQNRSTLFPCIVFLCYALCTIRHKKYQFVIRTAVLLMALFFFLLTIQNWITLIEQTVNELGNEGYNRNLALAYFLFEACPGTLEYIIGNGFLSAKTSTIMQDMMELGVYNSDVGFVGIWNQYGLIPVFVFGVILAKAIIGKRYSFITKCNAWFISACSLTTAYFAQDCKIVWACLFLYMYSIENYQTVNSKQKRHLSQSTNEYSFHHPSLLVK